MRPSTISRRTRTYLHPLRIAPPGMRPTGPELPWLVETGIHRERFRSRALLLAFLVIALLVPMQNENDQASAQATSPGLDSPGHAFVDAGAGAGVAPELTRLAIEANESAASTEPEFDCPGEYAGPVAGSELTTGVTIAGRAGPHIGLAADWPSWASTCSQSWR